MTFITIVISVLFLSCLLCLIRAIIGPTAPDRVVSVDAIISLSIAAFALLAVSPFGKPIYLDIALVYAFLAYLATLAVSKYLEGRGLER